MDLSQGLNLLIYEWSFDCWPRPPLGGNDSVQFMWGRSDTATRAVVCPSLFCRLNFCRSRAAQLMDMYLKQCKRTSAISDDNNQSNFTCEFVAMQIYLAKELCDFFFPHLFVSCSPSLSFSGILNFCANNYLGLSSHPEVVQAGIDALKAYGAGLSSVRFICGTQV